MIPAELKEHTQWTACYPGTKRPIIPPGSHDQGTTWIDVSKEHNYGFLLSQDDPYIVIDIDNNKENPVPVEVLLASTPQYIQDLYSKTYSELSPSGKGIHIVARVSPDEKAQINKAYFKAKDFAGQCSIKDSFMTFTGNIQSVSELATITLKDLEPYFRFSATPQVSEAEDLFANKDLPGLSKIKRFMERIPIDQSLRVKKVYRELTGCEYAHYDFWILIGMALHDYAVLSNQKVESLSIFTSWSEQDTKAFASVEDVITHWTSFTNKTPKISYKTLLKFAAQLEFDWPYPVVKKEGKTGNPIPNEFANFTYLLDIYELSIVYDVCSGNYFIKGDPSICDKYFKTNFSSKIFDQYYGPFSFDVMATCFLVFCQNNRYRSTTLRLIQDMIKTYCSTVSPKIDVLSIWLETPFAELPQNLQLNQDKNSLSTIDYIMEAIHVAPTMLDVKASLVRSLVKKWFMGMIKLREHFESEFDQNSGMLFFVGPENSRKTTFFNMLLPKPLRDLGLVKTVNTALRGDKEQRDFLRHLGSKMLVILDEYEGIDHNFLDSQLKNLITTNDVNFVDIYQTNERRMTRSAALCATSNEFKQRLSRNGTRRMWLVQVDFIDTDKLLDINWHYFYNELRKEFRQGIAKGDTPWLLTQDEIDLLCNRNAQVTASTDLQLMLIDIFGEPASFEDFKQLSSVQKDTTGHLFSTKMVADIILMKYPRLILKLSALENELERYCGAYTNTANKMISLTKPVAVVKNGRIMQHQKPNGNYQYKFWIMPKLDSVTF